MLHEDWDDSSAAWWIAGHVLRGTTVEDASPLEPRYLSSVSVLYGGAASNIPQNINGEVVIIYIQFWNSGI